MTSTPIKSLNASRIRNARDEVLEETAGCFTCPTRLGAATYDQNQILKSLRKVERGLRARFLSIAHDTSVALHIYQSLFPEHDIPIFANARAGSWYVPPLVRQRRTCTASFKSADGHYGQWSSSLRRPNVHVLEAALDSGAVVIVDVTRRGKRFPDSFMKTIPIWCAVMNNITRLYSCELCEEDEENLCHGCGRVQVHPDVPESERLQIQNRLPEWLRDWRRSIHALESAVPVLKTVRESRHAKPLRPIWISPESSLWEDGIPLHELEFTPIVCVSASKVVPEGDRSFIEPSLYQERVCDVDFPPQPVGFAYVQGAGDDEEAWCCGLSPAMFWTYFERLLTVADGEGEPGSAMDIEEKLKKEIARTISETSTVSNESCYATKGHQVFDIGRRIWSSRIMLRRTSLEDLPNLLRFASTQGHFVIVMGASSEMVRRTCKNSTSESPPSPKAVEWMPLVDRKGKPDYKYAFGRALGPCLSRLREFCVDKGKNVLICSTDKKGDWCAGLAIAWLAWHCDSNRAGQNCEELAVLDEPGYSVILPRKEHIGYIDKEKIHNTMLHFMSGFHEFELSRATLKQLNRFFSSPTPSSSLVDSTVDANNYVKS
ncbi:initiator tRNA phosphoribosyl transferase family protein [Gracilaria domingensis]|nr:initiator tRNA phosphoribosyl transferase family protein [Gracilaria domingensis]